MSSAIKDLFSSFMLAEIFKGMALTGRRAEKSLYNPEVCTFGDDEVYDQRDAKGFIRLNALRLRMRAMRDNG